jgi:hypothetical protein
MAGGFMRVGPLVHLLLALMALALVPAIAAAQPGSGPRETVDQTFTTTQPGSPTGLAFSGTYHAAGDPNGNPPYMRRMVFRSPPGLVYDTSVPDRCTATDAELSVRGPDACPPGSKLGGGTTEGLFYEPIAHSFLIDHYKHNLYIFNNTDEQIMLIESEGFTVVRGHVRPDGSVEFVPPSCFPAPPAGVPCADDYVLQLASQTAMPEYTKTSGGQVRSYVTTPPTCPPRRYWTTTIHYEWADGAVDDVATTQPCSR